MELPVFNDSLKSSGEWTARLARERELHQAWLESGGGTGEGVVDPALAQETAQLARAHALVTDWAAGPEPRLDRERLAEINQALRAADAPLFRAGPPPLLAALHDPAPAPMLPRLLDLAFDWFETGSFAELHPVEQATLVYLRLLDLSPFADQNEATALVAASFYTRRSGYPLLVLGGEEERSGHRQALEAAFGMLTQPLVEFFAARLIRSMQEERERKW